MTTDVNKDVKAESILFSWWVRRKLTNPRNCEYRIDRREITGIYRTVVHDGHFWKKLVT